jgi:hypothetical protein
VNLPRGTLAGLRFGMLTVLRRVNHNVIEVKCDCGTEKTIRRANLRTTRSCGCWKRSGKPQMAAATTRWPRGHSARITVLCGYKLDARDRGLLWELTDDAFFEITQWPCHYCSAGPSNVCRNPYGRGDFIYNGIDRKDNARGYVPDNVLPCCRICNRAKMGMDYQDFIYYLQRVADKWKNNA